MPNTAKLVLPYPLETDTADVPRDIQALAAKIDALAGAANGLALLDANAKLPTAQLYAAVANGVAMLDANAKVPLVELYAAVANGLATLDANGKVPVAQLPTLGSVPVAASLAALKAAIPAPGNGQKGMIVTADNSVTTLTYITALGLWVSDELPLGGTSPYIGTGGSSPTTTTQGVGYGAAFSGLSWMPASTGGLTLQLRWSGYLNGSGNAVYAHGGIYLYWIYNGGGVAATMCDRVGLQNTTTWVFTDWTNVANPGGYQMVAVANYLYTDPGGSAGLTNASVVGRWVG